MKHHLFDHIDIDPANVHIPDGTLPEDKYEEFAREYERKIKEAGGFDLALVGIGRTGHIGFNEPGSKVEDRTRLVRLHDITIKDAAPAFNGEENVPKTAITQGLGTVYDARHILLIATGKSKAEIIYKALEDEKAAENPSDCPAVYLRQHPSVTTILDKDAASQLRNDYTKK
jgi:glucosamine-6-phosphate deaminase